MFKKLPFLFLALVLSLSVFAESGIYVGGHFRRERTVTVPTLKASGFTYVILFNVQVEPNGDLTTDGDTICSKGVYIFDKKQPYYTTDVAALKTGLTSIRRIEMCVGGWTSPSYKNIKALITAQGYGSTTMLYKNFQALKKMIPSIEAVNNDEEDTYDVNTAAYFHVMLADIGYKTTLAPYTNKTFWQSLATKINTLRPGTVERIYIQCYDGGASNNPKDWNINNIPLHSGVWNFDASTTVKTKMTTWKSTSTTVGGFMWVYNDNSYSLKAYAKAMNDVFGGGEVVNRDSIRPYLTVYPECDFQGKGVNFEKGTYTKTAITARGVADKSLSSLKVAPGFKALLYKSVDATGESFALNSDQSCLVDMQLNDSISSWTVRADGDITLSGKTFYLKNRKSGMFISVTGESLLNYASLQQRVYSGKNDQKWIFTSEGNGIYRVKNSLSKKAMQVKDFSLDEGAILEQWTDALADNQRFIFQKTGVGNYYKIIPYLSTKYLKVEGTEPSVNGSAILQGGQSTDLDTDWELVTEGDVLALPVVSDSDSKVLSIHPNPVKDLLFVENGTLMIQKMVLTDLQGTNLITQNNSDNSINLSGLNAGMYFLQVYTEGKKVPFVSKVAKIN